jgi:hypothetical protein
MSLAAIDMLPEYALPTAVPSKRPEVSISEKVDKAQLVRRMLAAQVWARAAERVAESAIPTIDDSANTAKIESAVMGAFSELKRYEAYGRRWDGYFAEPFEQVVLERATEILRMARDVLVKEQFVPSLVTTGPASDGSVDIEIRDSKKKLFYTIYPETVIEVTAIKEGAAPVRRMFSFENMALARWLDWLAGKGNIPEEMEDNRLHSG